jgi:hypothetical protein
MIVCVLEGVWISNALCFLIIRSNVIGLNIGGASDRSSYRWRIRFSFIGHIISCYVLSRHMFFLALYGVQSVYSAIVGFLKNLLVSVSYVSIELDLA